MQECAGLRTCRSAGVQVGRSPPSTARSRGPKTGPSDAAATRGTFYEAAPPWPPAPRHARRGPRSERFRGVTRAPSGPAGAGDATPAPSAVRIAPAIPPSRWPSPPRPPAGRARRALPLAEPRRTSSYVALRPMLGPASVAARQNFAGRPGRGDGIIRVAPPQAPLTHSKARAAPLPCAPPYVPAHESHLASGRRPPLSRGVAEARGVKEPPRRT